MKKIAIEIKWGMVFFALNFVWVVLEKSVGLHDEYIDKQLIYTNLFAIPAIVVYVLALLDKRRNAFHNKMNWLQGFISGLIISLVVAVLSPLTQIIVHNYLTPEYFENIIAYNVKAGLMTRLEAEGYFNLNSYIFMSMRTALVMGAVTSAIVALFVRKQ